MEDLCFPDRTFRRGTHEIIEVPICPRQTPMDSIVWLLTNPHLPSPTKITLPPVPADACSDDPCENGGECTIDPAGGHLCSCAGDYGGMTCQTDTTCEHRRCDRIGVFGWSGWCVGLGALGYERLRCLFRKDTLYLFYQ